ncbi:MAG: uroporphyrinogen decarboxylase [Acidimicrobiia bacterium]
MKPIVEALHRRPLDRTPVWVMRQAGRYLPEYRDLRQRHTFQQAVSTPAVAAEITLQPIRRFGMNGAVIFADIMTPLEAMGVDMTFDPGPKLRPHTLAEVAALPGLDPERVGFLAETIQRVRAGVADEVAVIGFAGAPVTLLAYLVEGGGSKEFMGFRGACRRDPGAARAALDTLATAMNDYLRFQAGAGADAVQLFDTWAGWFDRNAFASLALPSARTALTDVGVPTIYFAPGAGHTLDIQTGVGASGYGVDWRVPLDQAWDRLGEVAVQGNLDPAVLLSDPETIAGEVDAMMSSVAGRAGHIVNLGHGIDRHTPPAHVAALVEAIRTWR